MSSEVNDEPVTQATDDGSAAPVEKGTKRKRGRAADPEETKQQLLDAAFESLRIDGFRGTTARAISKRASCNQAAIYYHFGGIEELLIAALDASSQRRLDRYREVVTPLTDLTELVAALGDLYAEDVSSGHMAVMGELLGGVTANPDLRLGVTNSINPWLEFVESKIREIADTLPLGSFVPATDVADLIFSMVVGLELRTKLDGNSDRADRFFRLATLAANLAQANQ